MNNCIIRFRMEDEPDTCACAVSGENLLSVAKRANVPVNAPCNGKGSCGRCLVRIIEGTLDSHKPFNLSDADYEDGWRIACLSRVNGDVTLEVKEI